MSSVMRSRVTLHTFAPSIFCQKVVYACACKELVFEEIHYDLFASADEAFVNSLTPMGRLPVLDIDSARYFESSSIIERIELIYETPTLVPESRATAAEVRHLDRVADNYLIKQFGSLFHHRYGLHRPFSDAALKAIVDQIRETLSWLNDQIGGHRFACGDTMSIADCSLIPVLHHCARIGLLERFSALNAYYERACQSIAVQKAVSDIASALGSVQAYETYRQRSEGLEPELSLFDF
jgi:glutathione S-transferase